MQIDVKLNGSYLKSHKYALVREHYSKLQAEASVRTAQCWDGANRRSTARREPHPLVSTAWWRGWRAACPSARTDSLTSMQGNMTTPTSHRGQFQIDRRPEHKRHGHWAASRQHRRATSQFHRRESFWPEALTIKGKSGDSDTSKAASLIHWKSSSHKGEDSISYTYNWQKARIQNIKSIYKSVRERQNFRYRNGRDFAPYNWGTPKGQ